MLIDISGTKILVQDKVEGTSDAHTSTTTDQQQSQDTTGHDLMLGRDRRVHVTFSTVDINYHPVILGDNPGGHGGPPIQIDWKPYDHTVVDIDRFESLREGRRRRHNDGSFILPATTRHILIERTGRSSTKEINDTIKDMQQIRLKRRQTSKHLIWKAKCINLLRPLRMTK